MHNLFPLSSESEHFIAEKGVIPLELIRELKAKVHDGVFKDILP